MTDWNREQVSALTGWRLWGGCPLQGLSGELPKRALLRSELEVEHLNNRETLVKLRPQGADGCDDGSSGMMAS